MTKKIPIPSEYTKKTTLANAIYYDELEIHGHKVVGYQKGQPAMTWYFRDYKGIDFVKANMNSQFAQVVFLTGMNSHNRFVGVDLASSQNRNIMKDTNRILFCNGMFSFRKSNDFACMVAAEIKAAFDNYRENTALYESAAVPPVAAATPADELKKYKELLDMGAITQAEFDAMKRQLLGLS